MVCDRVATLAAGGVISVTCKARNSAFELKAQPRLDLVNGIACWCMHSDHPGFSDLGHLDVYEEVGDHEGDVALRHYIVDEHSCDLDLVLFVGQELTCHNELEVRRAFHFGLARCIFWAHL